MANTIKPGSESTPVLYRHGRTGEVSLTIGIHPDLKDRLAHLAEDSGWTIKSLVSEAIRKHLSELEA